MNMDKHQENRTHQFFFSLVQTTFKQESVRIMSAINYVQKQQVKLLIFMLMRCNKISDATEREG